MWYRLHYKCEARDDSVFGDYDFNADNDEIALQVAKKFLDEKNDKEATDVREYRTTYYDRIYYKLMNVAIVTRQLIERDNLKYIA